MDINLVKKYKIISIVRGYDTEDTLKIVDTLKNAGIKLIEVTLNSPHAFKTIEELTSKYKDEVYIGAGTVLNEENCQLAINSGAKFIISPDTNPQVIKCAKKNNVLSIPGAFTPSEITLAINSGADIVKVFPISQMGSAYIKDILAPLNKAQLVPTGGVNIQNINDYLKYGAIGVGVSSSIVKTNLNINEQSLNTIKENAEKLIKAIN
ncbi:bifunctional 4-hydroxy-2-oxoglutarate aldolase/2-dehydro-3-deoxy-phosphogluconate aldolase [Staphylococcus sp. GDK8D30P]|uniref:bifunctional 4-hydroxy-2-oxoglutarate aldolase/2-dehydro-3-deoxy-phosphogluconate aldolase n=1 Tax=Staphylococcus sp. GDK8D30P TaxID=2804090 RepID=UPI001AEBF6D2|nr:bifunctional 4-hydroxy-2-oxoglutarate aldolase/2-dehydro-3-deoxy-phosphogluconate aldolase [Staphylococcus sp. GDK8D30P]